MFWHCLAEQLTLQATPSKLHLLAAPEKHKWTLPDAGCRSVKNHLIRGIPPASQYTLTVFVAPRAKIGSRVGLTSAAKGEEDSFLGFALAGSAAGCGASDAVVGVGSAAGAGADFEAAIAASCFSLALQI